jgi:hypothetical protein
MLHSVKDLENATISATDGQIGHVKDVYFDDELWVARYLVVNTGFWLTGRLVLISPISLRKPDWLGKTFPAVITKEQVRDSPCINTDKPVSRQHEEEYLNYFGYPFYWGGSTMWGDGLFPYAMEPHYTDYEADRSGQLRQVEAYARIEQIRHNNDAPHLRSCKAVTGYKLMASDGEIGHVTDFLLDETTWAIRYFVIETSHWWSGQKVLIAPEWIIKVHWSDKTVAVNLSQDSVRNSPSYDPKQEWSRKSDISLYEHYNREGYWPK